MLIRHYKLRIFTHPPHHSSLVIPQRLKVEYGFPIPFNSIMFLIAQIMSMIASLVHIWFISVNTADPESTRRSQVRLAHSILGPFDFRFFVLLPGSIRSFDCYKIAYYEIFGPPGLRQVLPVSADQQRLVWDEVDLSGPQQETRWQRRIRHQIIEEIPQLDQYSEDLVPREKIAEFRNKPGFVQAREKLEREIERGNRLIVRGAELIRSQNEFARAANQRLQDEHWKERRKRKRKFQEACRRYGGHQYSRPYTYCAFVSCRVCDHVYGPVHSWS